MALDIRDAKRIELRAVPDKRGAYEKRVYIFECITCGKEMPKDNWGIRNHTGYCVRCVKRNRHPLKTVWNGFLSSVNRTNERFKRDVPIDMTFDDFVFLSQIRVCAYCRDEVSWNEYRPGPYNMDRKDNTKGYSLDNILICCFKCNNRKGSHWDSDEFMLISDIISAWRSSGEHERNIMKMVIGEWRSSSITEG